MDLHSLPTVEFYAGGMVVAITAVGIVGWLAKLVYARYSHANLWQLGVVLTVFMMLCGVAYGFWQPVHTMPLTY